MKAPESQPVDPFKKGDYVTLSPFACRGVVYRVDKVDRLKYETWYTCSPEYGSFGANDSRGVRRQRADDMTKVDVITAGIENIRMLEFIRALARHESGETDDK